MSVARWGCEGSGVYVFDHCSLGLVCWDCPLATAGEGFVADPSETKDPVPEARNMLDHLQRHIDRGETVPESCIAELRSRLPEVTP